METDPPCPTSPYGASKAAMELLARVYAARGVPVVSLRYFSVYGRRQRPDMALQRILHAGLGGPVFRLRGDGRQQRDLTHVDDIVEATLAAAAADLAGGTVLNVGSGRPQELRHVLDVATQVLGRPVPVAASHALVGDVAATWADTRRTAELLGVTPKVRLEDGIADQLDFLLATATPRQPTTDLPGVHPPLTPGGRAS